MQGARGESVLVTGGGGFVGTWVLRDLLSRGLRVVVVDVQKSDERWRRILGGDMAKVAFVAGSLLDRGLLQRTADEQRVSHIIHLAALLTPTCQQDPYSGCEINVLGSVALFEMARACAGRIRGISYASSYAVYGPEADDPVLGLTAADNRPPSFYGVFKMAVDSIAEQYWRHFGIASVGIRPHVVYGPERTAGLTAAPSQACRAAAVGEFYSINYTGRVGYDYVEDVARAFVQSSLQTPRGSILVDLPGRLATTEEIVGIIDRIIPGAGSRITVDGPSFPPNIPPKPHYISALFPDWRATTLEEGIRKTVDFYRKQP
jgi:nucleoside-diphosphate-sugar epimerase